MKKIPKPKINDSVERTDMSKVLGVVKGIVSIKLVKVEWTNNNITIEKIKDLALVERKYKQ